MWEKGTPASTIICDDQLTRDAAERLWLHVDLSSNAPGSVPRSVIAHDRVSVSCGELRHVSIGHSKVQAKCEMGRDLRLDTAMVSSPLI